MATTRCGRRTVETRPVSSHLTTLPLFGYHAHSSVIALSQLSNARHTDRDTLIQSAHTQTMPPRSRQPATNCTACKATAYTTPAHVTLTAAYSHSLLQAYRGCMTQPIKSRPVYTATIRWSIISPHTLCLTVVTMRRRCDYAPRPHTFCIHIARWVHTLRALCRRPRQRLRSFLTRPHKHRKTPPQMTSATQQHDANSSDSHGHVSVLPASAPQISTLLHSAVIYGAFCR